jgi:hypothetical protein
MHEHMPIGGDEWDLVLELHSQSYPDRVVESLHRKVAQLHGSKTPTGDPKCPQEVKLAKRIEYTISSRANIGDGTEEVNLATGTFTNVAPAEEAGEEDASSLGDDAADGEEEELEDEVPGEFEAPSIPNDDINLLLAQRTTQVEGTQYTIYVAARAPATSPVAARTPAVTARPPTVAMTPMPTSRGSTLARPLVSPYKRRGSNRNNPQHGGLMQHHPGKMLKWVPRQPISHVNI